MFSVTRTGMNVRPLCTANVRPTMSGMIVDARAHVRIAPRARSRRALGDLFHQLGVHEWALFYRSAHVLLTRLSIQNRLRPMDQRS